MTEAFPFVVPVLLSAALSCAAQSPRASVPKIIGTIYDIDSGQPLSNTPLKVQLFPPEHGGRKFQSLLCSPSDNAQPLSSSLVTTDSNGSFNLTAQGGDYLAKMTIQAPAGIRLHFL